MIRFAAEHPEVLVMSADLGSSCEVKKFRQTYPDRYLTMGIAEQNMCSWAAGMCREGYRPFLHTFAVFLYRRILDQLEMSVAYPNLPVVFVGFVPGITTPGGVTHQSINDIGVLRTVPNMAIFDIGDATEIEGVLDLAYNYNGPVYIRMLRKEVPRLFPANEPMQFNRARVLSEGDDIVLLSSSICTEEAMRATAVLKEKGVSPKLAIVRCGENPSDLSYEKGATARAELIGVEVQKFVLPEDVSKEDLIAQIEAINADSSIHGCLMFRPLPKHLKADQDEICNHLAAAKDVDCMTDLSNAGVFTGKKLGFAPCTPQACMEILDYYGIDCKGKNAVVIGRSLVVGKPAAMMLMAKNATVTVCHTKTVDVAGIARKADILVSAAGVLNSLTKDYVSEDQIVIDVSINWDPEKVNAKGGKGAIAGDAVFSEVEPIVGAITPVPGGVGSVTTSVLIGHVVEAAERTL